MGHSTFVTSKSGLSKDVVFCEGGLSKRVLLCIVCICTVAYT